MIVSVHFFLFFFCIPVFVGMVGGGRKKSEKETQKMQSYGRKLPDAGGSGPCSRR